MFKKPKAVPVGLLLATAALFLSLITGAKAQNLTDDECKKLVTTSLATVVRVYSELKAKNPDKTPQEIAAEEEVGFITRANDLIKQDMFDGTGADFYTFKVPSDPKIVSTDPKTIGINSLLFYAVVAGLLDVNKKLPKKSLNAAEQADYIKKLDDENNPAFTPESVRAIAQMFAIHAHSAFARIAQRPAPTPPPTKEGFALSISAQTSYNLDIMAGKVPISSLPGPANSGIRHYITVMKGGDEPQPDGKPIKTYPGWVNAVAIYQGFFSKLPDVAFPPKAASPQP